MAIANCVKVNQSAIVIQAHKNIMELVWIAIAENMVDAYSTMMAKKVNWQCDEGYSEQDGHCVYCYCGDNSVCEFNSTHEKICNCSSGYEAVNGFCTDIDECVDLKVCPVTEKCVNLPGSYICGCADGYIHTGSGCSDINECLEKDICGGNNRECVNTPGSFECMCKSGYLSRGGPKKFLICERNSAWKVGYGVLSVLFVAITIGLLVILYRKYRIGKWFNEDFAVNWSDKLYPNSHFY